MSLCPSDVTQSCVVVVLLLLHDQPIGYAGVVIHSWIIEFTFVVLIKLFSVFGGNVDTVLCSENMALVTFLLLKMSCPPSKQVNVLPWNTVAVGLT